MPVSAASWRIAARGDRPGRTSPASRGVGGTSGAAVEIMGSARASAAPPGWSDGGRAAAGYQAFGSRRDQEQDGADRRTRFGSSIAALRSSVNLAEGTDRAKPCLVGKVGDRELL